jgi:hypothetical protein
MHEYSWIWISVFALLLGTVASIISLEYLPESLRFLINQKWFQQAKEALDMIAETNNKVVDVYD